MTRLRAWREARRNEVTHAHEAVARRMLYIQSMSHPAKRTTRRAPRGPQSVVVLALVLAASATSACGGASEVVPLLTAAGVPLTQPTTVPLRVVTRSTAVQDPIPVRGSAVAYTDIEGALGHAIASATVPWAEAHRGAPGSKEGWELFVEVTSDGATYDGGRMVFSIGVRATLHQRAGNVYVAQTQASCRQAAVTRPDQGAPTMYRCMMGIGRDLAGWLDGVNLDASVATPTHS